MSGYGDSSCHLFPPPALGECVPSLRAVERGAQAGKRLLGPVSRRALGADAKIEARGRNEHAIGVLEAATADAVEPNRKCRAKSGARLLCWADEIGDDSAPSLHDSVAQPPHPPRLLDSIGMAEAEIARDIRTHCVSIENDRIKERRKAGRERGFARAGQAHDQDFPHPLFGLCGR